MTKRSQPLGVGIIGGGFIARFHIRSWVGVRDANILGVFDPDEKRAGEPAPWPGASGSETRAPTGPWPG